MDVLFIIGIFDFSFYMLTLLFNIIFNSTNGTFTIYFKFFEFYNEKGITQMITRFLLGFIFLGLLKSTVEFALIKELSPNFIIVIYDMTMIPSYIINIGGINEWLTLFISLIQIIILLFYLEILEFNFCSLNKNTRKNIMIREKNQDFNDNDNEIDIKGYDISESIKNQEKDIELIELNERNEVVT